MVNYYPTDSPYYQWLYHSDNVPVFTLVDRYSDGEYTVGNIHIDGWRATGHCCALALYRGISKHTVMGARVESS